MPPFRNAAFRCRLYFHYNTFPEKSKHRRVGRADSRYAKGTVTLKIPFYRIYAAVRSFYPVTEMQRIGRRVEPAAYLLKARLRSQLQFTKLTLLFAAFTP